MIFRIILIILVIAISLHIFNSKVDNGSNNNESEGNIMLDLRGTDLKDCSFGNVRIIGRYKGDLKVKVTFKNGDRITRINGKDYKFGGNYITIKHGRLVLDGIDVGAIN